MSIDTILDGLSARIRHYSLAHSVDDVWLEDATLTEVGSLVEALLAAHLRGASGWDTRAWIERVVLRSLEVSDTGVAVWSGMAMWYAHEAWFLDPLTARFELSADRTAILDYLIQFGDAEVGLGTIRHEPTAQPRLGTPPVRWCFVFPESR